MFCETENGSSLTFAGAQSSNMSDVGAMNNNKEVFSVFVNQSSNPTLFFNSLIARSALPFPVRVTTIQIVIPLFQQLLGFLLYVATVCSREGGEVELEGDAGGFQVMVVLHRHIFISRRVGE